MHSLLNQVLKDSELRIQRLQEQMREFEKNPMILVTDIFTNNDLFLPQLIHEYGDDALLEIQDYWFNRFFPHFKHFLGIEEISFSYDKTIYPAPINIHLGEEVIAVVDIVTHHFERFEEESVIQEREKSIQITNDLEMVQAELEKKEPAIKNPFILGGSNVAKLLDISIRQKKYKKQAIEIVKDLQEYFFELERERLRTESTIEHLKRINVEREYTLDRIEKRIRTLPGYAPITNASEELESDNSIEWERGFSL